MNMYGFAALPLLTIDSREVQLEAVPTGYISSHEGFNFELTFKNVTHNIQFGFDSASNFIDVEFEFVYAEFGKRINCSTDNVDKLNIAAVISDGDVNNVYTCGGLNTTEVSPVVIELKSNVVGFSLRFTTISEDLYPGFLLKYSG